jgi:hypothetical protein
LSGHECSKIIPNTKKFSRELKMGVQLFIPYKKVSKCPQVSTKDVKVHFGQWFGLCKENFCTCESMGYQN